MTRKKLEARLRAEVAARPRLRGVFHQYGFFAALIAGIFIIVGAPTTRSLVAVAIYSFSLCALLGTSALYHRVPWQPRALRIMRRLDHGMIFILIAGTCTPFAILIMRGRPMAVMLGAIWGIALAGIIIKQVWIRAPKWAASILYVASGVVGGILLMPSMLHRIGIAPVLLVALGGVLYIVGAAIFGLRRPNPVPGVLGFHEVFHLLVILAAAVHMGVIIAYVVPLEG
jgi:hemolysin III